MFRFSTKTYLSLYVYTNTYHRFSITNSNRYLCYLRQRPYLGRSSRTWKNDFVRGSARSFCRPTRVKGWHGGLIVIRSGLSLSKSDILKDWKIRKWLHLCMFMNKEVGGLCQNTGNIYISIYSMTRRHLPCNIYRLW